MHILRFGRCHLSKISSHMGMSGLRRIIDPDERERMTEEINVFFSYAHDDKNSENGAVVVDRLKQLIEEKSDRKIKIWLDTYSIPRNKDWRELITGGIVESDRFVGFMSRKALRDPGVCRDELGIAVGSRYGIISCVLLEGERTLNPPAEFTERQWIDLSDWKRSGMKAKRNSNAF